MDKNAEAISDFMIDLLLTEARNIARAEIIIEGEESLIKKRN